MQIWIMKYIYQINFTDTSPDLHLQNCMYVKQAAGGNKKQAMVDLKSR